MAVSIERAESARGGHTIVVGSAAVVLLVGLALVALPGCGGYDDAAAVDEATKEGDSKAEAEPQAGFATPQEAFEALKTAEQAQDWAAQLAAHTPDSQERIVGSVAQAAVMFGDLTGKKAQIADLLKKHGVDPSTIKESPSTMLPGDLGKKPPGKDDIARMFQKMAKRQRELGAAIKDRSAFYVELMTLMEEGSESWPGSTLALSPGPDADAGEEQVADAKRARAEAKLVDVQIRDDFARAKQEIAYREQTLKLPVYFQRMDGRWFIHQPEMAEAMQMGPPRIEIKARIDGHEKVYLHPDRMEWEHLQWSWPAGVTVNGTKWNPQKSRTFDLEPGIRWAMRFVDFHQAQFYRIKGRGKVVLFKADDHLVAVFQDPEPGADDYEILIFFED